MEGGSDRSGRRRDDRTLRYRATFDPTGERTLLDTVVEGLAAVLDADPRSLEPPLATVAAWEALESLIERHVGDGPSPIDYVEFTYRGYVVTIYGDGQVCLYEGRSE